MTFTNPHYWATKAGRQYEIDLSKGIRAICCTCRARRRSIRATSRSSTDFRAFGPDEFRHNVEARRRASRAHGGSL